VISKGALVVPAKPVAAAESMYPVPALSMLRLENVATPATALTAVVPESTASPSPVPDVIDSVTLPVNPVTV
jgi:hypothetical protein